MTHPVTCGPNARVRPDRRRYRDGVSFFEPAPPPEPLPERHWSPPLWDRPSEGTIPALVPVNELLHVGSEIAVALQSVSVYPNGFVVNFLSIADPHATDGRVGMPFFGGFGRPDLTGGMPRVGVRFADGRTAGREASFGEIDKDGDGVPTQPIVHMAGGGGGSRGFTYSVWVFPLPPDGPVEVFLSVPAIDLDECRVLLDGGAIRGAAAAARPIWT